VGEIPPLTGTAVNVTLVPVQIVFPEPEDIVTDGTTEEDTVIVVPELAVVGDAHIAFDVMVQVTTSPLFKLPFE